MSCETQTIAGKPVSLHRQNQIPNDQRSWQPPMDCVFVFSFQSRSLSESYNNKRLRFFRQAEHTAGHIFHNQWNKFVIYII